MYRVLQAGDFNLDYYDKSLYEEFEDDGNISVDKFEWAPYFKKYQYNNPLSKFYFTFENRYKSGCIVKKINYDLAKKVSCGSYDVVFLWRAIHIYPSTIAKLKKHAVVIGYNNDQTFSSHHPWWLFFILKRSVRSYDHFYVYRQSDKPIIENLGVSSSVFMPTFDPKIIKPLKNIEKVYDVAFIGHYENDGRDTLLLRLIQEGFKVRLNGQRWHESRLYKQLAEHLGEIEPAYGNYNEALNSAKVCLSFLSKLNNDTYTRRTLEIPATRTVMLAEYTLDQANMFKPDIEAVYFSNHQQAVEKLNWLIKNPNTIDSIANAGYKKVLQGPYQLNDRIKDIIKVTKEKMAIKSEK
ncbi:glycosyltransferase [Pseudoalteromonas arctica]|uniref:glycosyltransferase n=1 Tax=Pseudoalteromonas arctica TaxID=394751 RepID=UPI00249507A7|nr:glycosyltransferase [Pseudoalteromonas arctica]